MIYDIDTNAYSYIPIHSKKKKKKKKKQTEKRNSTTSNFKESMKQTPPTPAVLIATQKTPPGFL